MTKDEMIIRIADRILPQFIALGTWADLVNSVQAMDTTDQNKLLQATLSGDTQEVGSVLVKALRVELKASALIEATNMLADDSLSLAELEQIL